MCHGEKHINLGFYDKVEKIIGLNQAINLCQAWSWGIT